MTSTLTKPLIAESIGDLVGKTPLLRLSKKTNTGGADILLKLESENPMASVKDRLALSIIDNAEKDGLIKPGVNTLIEATSGNTGVALAQLGAARGYKVVIVMPDSMSLERRALIRIFGATLILTPAKFGIKGANAVAQKIFETTEGGYLTKQFDTSYNAKIHRETTGPEILEQTSGNVDVVIGGSGTGGTMTGVAQYFIAQGKKDTKFMVIEPEESPVLSGGTHSPHKIQGLAPGFIPSVIDVSLFSEVLKVHSDKAIEMARALPINEGLFVGISSGAAVQCAVEVSSRPEYAGKTIVVIIPSFGERYLSTALYKNVLEEVSAQQAVEVPTA